MKCLYKYRYSVLMLLAILLVLWPLTFYVFIPKWDNVDAFLPYRYMISDFFWNGHFPYWNSFQLYGYPAYADPQSGMWNPITWIIILFGKYTMGSLISELLIYFGLAGLGMFWLISSIYKNEKLAAILGFSYALSGIMVGSAQLLVFISGVAWLPWCMAAMYRFSKTFQYKYVVLSGLFIALNTVVASPAYTIVLIYIYFFIFIYLFWQYRKEKKKLLHLVLAVAVMLGVASTLLLPYIITFIDFAPYYARLEKVSYDKYAVLNSYVPINLISLIFPYTVVSGSEMFSQTDITLRNSYVGIVGLFYFLYTVIVYRKNRNIQILTLFSFLFLLAAFGKYTPLYKILYQLPAFGLFKHPSFFRSYTVFLMLIVAGYGLN